MELEYKELTDVILRSFYKVYKKLGYGFLEKVYENAMIIEFNQAGIICQNQYPIKVYYDGQKIGDYYADLLIDGKVIIELKAVDVICLEHEYQLLNYLKATGIKVGILLNFGKQPEFRRKIF